jgi:hypothetical protein
MEYGSENADVTSTARCFLLEQQIFELLLSVGPPELRKAEFSQNHSNEITLVICGWKN